MKTKFNLLFSLAVAAFAATGVYGQVRTDISVREQNNSAYGIGEHGYNGHNFSMGFGVGSSKLYGDWAYSNPQPVYIGYLEKNVTPSISLGWTISVGDLSSRDPFSFYRSFNHFTSVDQHVTIELGTLFSFITKDYYDYYVLRFIGGLYFGGGIGIINNDVKRIANFNESAPGQIETGNPTMLTNTTALYAPFNFGYNLYIPKLLIFNGCTFNINYQYAMAMTDYIDGYKPPYVANKKNDIFSVLSVGFRFYVFHPAEY